MSKMHIANQLLHVTCTSRKWEN